MAKFLEMPKLSPTMEEGQIAAWKKKEGDAVGIDDLLAEVETDKATMEFRSFDRGTLLKILVPAGSMVQLGQAVAVMGEPGEDISRFVAAPAPAQAPPQASPALAVTAIAQLTPAKAVQPSETLPNPSFGADGRVKASPYVRKLARERSIDLRGVPGSGPQGRIIARDLAAEAPPVAPAPPVAASPDASPDVEVRPHSMMRRTIARRLQESKQTIPHFYLTIDVDAEPLHVLRERSNQELAAWQNRDGQGAKELKLSINDYLVKAVALSLKAHPAVNAQFTQNAIVVHHRVQISVAVAVDDGLVTPVIRDADQRSVREISLLTRELAARAREKKLKPEEMLGGTFSISNLGMFGIDEFSAVINPPEGAILAIGQIRRVPVVQGDALVPGRRLAMTMSCDHRVIDGAVGARFLKDLRLLIERPNLILL